jgi:hypothetical protein
MENIEILNFVVSSLSTLLAAIAILLYIVLWFKDKTQNNYDVFDAVYLDILKTGMDNPEFRNPAYTRNYKNLADNDKIRYETYAFICWNFCETIVDKGDKNLMKTWGVVIETENALHRTWFDSPENRSKFKEEFISYILQNYQTK